MPNIAAPDTKPRVQLKGEAHAVLALRRGLMILDTISARRSELGVNEIARLVGLHKSTVSRLCATLEHAGYLERDASTNRFRLGGRAYHLAGVVVAPADLRAVARPVMVELVQSSRETATLGVREGSDIVTIDVVEGLNHMRMATRVGMRTQIHASAVAKAILAWSQEEDVDAVLANWPMKALTPSTITDALTLKERLSEVRREGYAVDMEELEVGLRCVAAPIRDPQGRVVAAVSISGPRHSMTQESMDRFGDLVRSAASTISARLGASPSLRDGMTAADLG